MRLSGALDCGQTQAEWAAVRAAVRANGCTCTWVAGLRATAEGCPVCREMMEEPSVLRHLLFLRRYPPGEDEG